MTGTAPTTRWLITAILAAWLPLCACQATGLVRTGLSLAGIHAANDGRCCCVDSESRAPSTASCRVGCCGTTQKVPPRPDRWEPTKSTTPTTLPHALLAAARPSPAGPATRARRHDSAGSIPSAECSLLRQHCALIV